MQSWALGEPFSFEQKGFTVANTSVVLWGGRADFGGIRLIFQSSLQSSLQMLVKRGWREMKKSSGKTAFLHFEDTKATNPFIMCGSGIHAGSYSFGFVLHTVQREACQAF